MKKKIAYTVSTDLNLEGLDPKAILKDMTKPEEGSLSSREVFANVLMNSIIQSQPKVTKTNLRLSKNLAGKLEALKASEENTVNFTYGEFTFLTSCFNKVEWDNSPANRIIVCAIDDVINAAMND